MMFEKYTENRLCLRIFDFVILWMFPGMAIISRYFRNIKPWIALHHSKAHIFMTKKKLKNNKKQENV